MGILPLVFDSHHVIIEHGDIDRGDRAVAVEVAIASVGNVAVEESVVERGDVDTGDGSVLVDVVEAWRP